MHIISFYSIRCNRPYYYDKTTTSCILCSRNCLKCNIVTVCLECMTPFVLTTTVSGSIECTCPFQLVSGICYDFDNSPIKGCVLAEINQSTGAV